MRNTSIALTILAFFALGAMVIFVVAGCGRTVQDESQAPASTATGDVVVCPVMGTEITDVSKAAGKSVHKGKTYYFCCPGCKPKFDADPEKYVVVGDPNGH